MTRRIPARAGLCAACLLLGAAGADTATLLSALAAAPDAHAASTIEQRLTDAWYSQATPAVQLLLSHAAMSIGHGKPADALADCNAAVTLQPDLADLYRRRAEARYADGDDRGAIADLAQSLAREPRLVPALMDLSRIAEARKDYPRALQAWKKVLELDPRTEGGARRLDLLTRKVNGEPT